MAIYAEINIGDATTETAIARLKNGHIEIISLITRMASVLIDRPVHVDAESIRYLSQAVEEEAELTTDVIDSTMNTAIHPMTEVGIGIDQARNSAIHYKKLPKEHPLFERQLPVWLKACLFD